tara:strand:- start:573 stop:734 length:162 start_codon:yes stop_codon:yes gene_type:complete
VKDQLLGLGHSDIRLVEGNSGVFDILIDKKEVFSKTRNNRNAFPTATEIANIT